MTFPVFYFVKIRNGSAKLRSIFLVISVIQNRGEKKNKKMKIENTNIFMENPKTQNKMESKPKSNLNLSSKKTQYKVIFHIQIFKKWRKMYWSRFDESLSCKETPNRSARRIFFWILKAGDPHQQHPVLQAAATVLFKSSLYFASELTVVIEGLSEASSVCSSSSSSSRGSGGRDSSSSSFIV